MRQRLILTTTALIAAAMFAVMSSGYAADDAAACDRQLVMQIDSAKISMEPDGFEIAAFGTSESAGWKSPTLILSGAVANGVATVDFVACRPEASAQVLTPIQTRALLDLDMTTRQVVIRARTNSMTVDISAE